MYVLFDITFIIFHTVLILFNLFGWLWKASRRWNLATLLFTGFSWLGLGIWYGLGYCPCTDWHWMVRRKLGYTEMPNSYIKFLIEQLTGIDVSAAVVDTGTVIFFALAIAGSLYVNIRDYRNKNKN
ncbi:Protein of Unknown function (DUF2784) [Fodinibius salinus]|uniref:DUF2784 domain-containing protein n=1 Tax=Fodinibius salinus TaxID=860790 RepID=A0A5D3YHW6_9BACT|nr:DUF2784 domain-containing protein [Fodinibius salinus]TYP92119.1 Protein of Unknown function (DUF2784) [Fodinibius salinus]